MSDSLMEFEDEFIETRPNGHAKPESRVDVFKLMRVALGMLGNNLLLIFGAMSTFALFGYAILHPDILRIIIASLYGSIVFLPTMFKRRER